MSRVALIEDHGRLAGMVRQSLSAAGIEFDLFGNISEASYGVSQGDYAVLIIDRRLPDGDGLTFLRALRAAGQMTPSLMLTARDAMHDRVDGIEGDWLARSTYAAKEGRMKQLILVVDGDVACRDALRTHLQSSGFDVAVLYEPEKVASRVEAERPALVVMTSGPRFGSGLAALKTLRHRGDDLPLIMLGEHDDVIERVVALECGADDFICKPFNVHEALVRIRCVLKRAARVPRHNPAFKPPFRFKGFELNFASRTLTFHGEAVPLWQKEYAILNLFTTAPGLVFSKEVIAQYIWPYAPNQQAAVGVWVHRLRKRIERDATAPELIQTVRAKGYAFRPGFDD